MVSGCFLGFGLGLGRKIVDDLGNCNEHILLNFHEHLITKIDICPYDI